MPQNSNNGQQQFLGAGIAIGIAIGAGLGVALGNLTLGIGLGTAIGTSLGVAMSRGKRSCGKREDADGADGSET